ncbi:MULTISPECIES: hypothetical protein [unclassified Crossiella]|uniref:hypothetical protein n=1 Tax=unclassified Crossiella TaxID=2620835 RepID=UPI001FFFAC31|nr:MULTISPECIES: hypothetical protein [unclassified Crossiella]MCK2236914.1 hypothetical protein [Crossiella sp. S99.2]MCK2250582.1 hypothetical protein [Crossiella sp. S99.1]
MTGPAPQWGQAPGGYPPPGLAPGPRKPSLVAVVIAFVWVLVSAGVEVGFGLSAAGGSRQGGFHLGVGQVKNDILGYYAIPGAMLLTVLLAVLTLFRQNWARFVLLGPCLVFAGVHLWRLIEMLPRGLDVLELVTRIWFVLFWLIGLLLYLLPPVNRALGKPRPMGFPAQQFGGQPGWGAPPQQQGGHQGRPPG